MSCECKHREAGRKHCMTSKGLEAIDPMKIDYRLRRLYMQHSSPCSQWSMKWASSVRPNDEGADMGTGTRMFESNAWCLDIRVSYLNAMRTDCGCTASRGWKGNRKVTVGQYCFIICWYIRYVAYTACPIISPTSLTNVKDHLVSLAFVNDAVPIHI